MKTLSTLKYRGSTGMKYLVLLIAMMFMTGCSTLDRLIDNTDADTVISVAVVSQTAGSAANVYQAYLLETGREDLLQSVQGSLRSLIDRKDAAENMATEDVLLLLARRGEVLAEIEADYNALYDAAVIAESESGVKLPYRLTTFHGEVSNLYDKLRSGVVADSSARADLYLQFATRIAMAII